MWIVRGLAVEAKITFRNVEWRRNLSAMRKAVEKRRPPPGGEEAEVVVYQPRGVGLMHTRRRPGNAHYTHASADQRKGCLLKKAQKSRAGRRRGDLS